MNSETLLSYFARTEIGAKESCFMFGASGEDILETKNTAFYSKLILPCLLWFLLLPIEVLAQEFSLKDNWRAEHMVLATAVAQGRIFVGTQSGVVQIFTPGKSKAAELIRFLAEEEGGFPPAIRGLAFNDAETHCLIAVADDRLIYARVRGDEAEQIWVLPNLRAMKVLFRDSSSLIVGDMSGELHFLDLADGQQLFREQKEYAPVSDMELSPSGNLLAVSFNSSRVLIVDANTGENLHWLAGHKDQVFGVSWQSEQLLLSGSKDKRLLLHDLNHADRPGKELMRNDRYVTALAIRSDGLGVWCRDESAIGTFRMTGDHRTQLLTIHTAPIQVLEFMEQGNTLLSSGNDAKVCLWQINE